METRLTLAGRAMAGNELDPDSRGGLEAIAERYRVVLGAISEGVYDWNVATGELKVSGRLGAILGLEPNRLSAADWNERINGDNFAGYRDAIVRHFKGETDHLVCEYRVKSASGDYIWVSDTGRCLRRENGKAYRLVGAIQDITGRKLAESRLTNARQEAEEARARLQDAIESISEGLVLFDAQDRIILCNSNYRDYFAAVAGDEVAERIEPGELFWDVIREAHASGMLPLIDGQGGIDEYIELRRSMRKNPTHPIEQLLADGRWLQINEHRTADGGVASVYTDITELKKREEELSNKTHMLETLSSKLSKYLSPQVYASIFAAPERVAVEPRRRKLTVFFSDIVGFTAMVDRLESEQVTELLNQYLTEMARIANEYGATIDKFIGDAIVAFFGDPHSRGVALDACACVGMARAMQDKQQQLRRQWFDRGLGDTFELRIGIATGFCTVGNFGSVDRLDYTAIGHAVNLASRL